MARSCSTDLKGSADNRRRFSTFQDQYICMEEITAEETEQDKELYSSENTLCKPLHLISIWKESNTMASCEFVPIVPPSGVAQGGFFIRV